MNACSDENTELLVELQHGRLSAADAEAMLEHLAGCEVCAAAFEFRLDVETAVTPEIARPTSQNKPMATGVSATTRPAPWYRRPRILGVAAAFLITVVGVWTTIGVYRNTNPTRRGITHLADLTPVPFIEGTLRGSSEDTSASAVREFRDAMDAYGGGDYPLAASRLMRLQGRAPQDAKVHLYLGIARLQLRQFPEAQRSLERAREHSDGLLHERAVWYLAMGAIASGQASAATRHLRALRDLGGSYATSAAELLQKIGAASEP